jgi:hypothetical protein
MKKVRCAAFFWSLLLLPFLLGSFAHPLKMSYTAIKYLPQEKKLSVTFRIFQDDFEVGLQNNYGYNKNILETGNTRETLDYIYHYLDQQFDFKVNGRELFYQFIRMTPEAQLGLVLEYELSGFEPGEIREIEVRNEILIDQFPQQVNMFYVHFPGVIKTTEKFDRDEVTETWEVNGEW